MSGSFKINSQSCFVGYTGRNHNDVAIERYLIQILTLCLNYQIIQRITSIVEIKQRTML